jgi:hypothetical protein
MKVIKKYTAIQLGTRKINNDIEIELSYGSIEGPHYSTITPQEEFDTEEEALEYAYEKDKYRRWLIVPLIRFENEYS